MLLFDILSVIVLFVSLFHMKLDAQASQKDNIKIFISPLLSELYHPRTARVADHAKCFLSWKRMESCYASSLGSLISEKDCLWDTSNYYYRDVWFFYHLKTKYPYITSYENADIVFVPIYMFFNANRDNFFNDALKMFPYLLSKPHVIVLSNSIKETNLSHPMALYFHYISHANLFPRKLHNINVTMVPYLWRKHYTDGYVNPPFNNKQIIDIKRNLLFGSWRPRSFFVEREIWMNNCLQNTRICKWLPWSATPIWSGAETYDPAVVKSLGIQSMRYMQSSWYTMLPTGDDCLRNSMYDAFQLDSIAIIPDYCFNLLPFQNIVDYHKFVLPVPITNDASFNIVYQVRLNFSKVVALSGLEYLSNIRHIFQYSLNPKLDNIAFSTLNEIDSYDDALSFTLKSLTYELCMHGRLDCV